MIKELNSFFKDFKINKTYIYLILKRDIKIFKLLN